MYARTLEAATSPSIRFRAAGAYQALFEICRNKNPPVASSNKFVSYKEWMDDPNSWFELG